jgi:hypothetical protein
MCSKRWRCRGQHDQSGVSEVFRGTGGGSGVGLGVRGYACASPRRALECAAGRGAVTSGTTSLEHKIGRLRGCRGKGGRKGGLGGDLGLRGCAFARQQATSALCKKSGCHHDWPGAAEDKRWFGSRHMGCLLVHMETYFRVHILGFNV